MRHCFSECNVDYHYVTAIGRGLWGTQLQFACIHAWIFPWKVVYT